MLFSIIIPMYNLENYIQETLNSILQNDLSDCELILLSDGSIDKTVEVAEALLKEKCPCYYAIIKKENTGVSDTRNQGIKAAKGKYIIFCDGDDFFEPDLLGTLRKELADDIDMAAWPYYIMEGEHKKISQNKGKDEIVDSAQMMRKHLREGYRLRLGSFVIKRECLVDNEIFFEKECTFAEDMEFIMKCLFSVEKIQWIHVPLFCYVKREGSLVNSYNMRRFEASRAIGRMYQYIVQNDCVLEEEIKEYIENGLFVLHYIYSLEACLQSLHTWKIGKQLWNAIKKDYSDVEESCRVKIKNMQMAPYGISKKRIALLKLGTKVYINMRILAKKIGK